MIAIKSHRIAHLLTMVGIISAMMLAVFVAMAVSMKCIKANSWYIRIPNNCDADGTPACVKVNCRDYYSQETAVNCDETCHAYTYSYQCHDVNSQEMIAKCSWTADCTPNSQRNSNPHNDCSTIWNFSGWTVPAYADRRNGDYCPSSIFEDSDYFEYF